MSLSLRKKKKKLNYELLIKLKRQNMTSIKFYKVREDVSKYSGELEMDTRSDSL